jgi:hypothetical protein
MRKESYATPHQDDRWRVRAADTAKRASGNQLANTGNFGAAAAGW